MLEKILKKHITDQTIIDKINEDMRTEKIFMTKEENIDTRYSKLKEQHDLTTKEHSEASKLIEELKKSVGDQEATNTKIAEYEVQVRTLQEEKVALQLDNAIKVDLLTNKAKPADIDYLMFKIKGGDYELSVDDQGNLKGLDMKSIQTTHPGHFEESAKKEVIPNKLPKGEPGGSEVSKEKFESMGYNERLQMKQSDPDQYNKLKN